MIFNYNPSVSLTADSSLYTREPLKCLILACFIFGLRLCGGSKPPPYPMKIWACNYFLIWPLKTPPSQQSCDTSPKGEATISDGSEITVSSTIYWFSVTIPQPSGQLPLHKGAFEMYALGSLVDFSVSVRRRAVFPTISLQNAGWQGWRSGWFVGKLCKTGGEFLACVR